ALEAALRAFDAPVRHLDQYLAGDRFPLVPALAVFLAAAVAYRLRSESRRAAFGPFATTLLAGWLLWMALCVFYLHGFRSWYGLYHAVPLYAIAVPVLLAVILERAPRRGFATLLGAAIVGFVSFFSEGGPSAPQEYDKLQSARAAGKYLRDLGPGVRVGAFNTGIYQFYTDVDVLNLDGVVNPEALAAHRQDRIADYMRERNVRVLVENDPGRSATFRQVYGRKDIHFERWIDLSKEYEPYPGPPRLARHTSLWRVTYPSDGEGWDAGGQAMLRGAGRGAGGS
ncbi:hypothetical protein K8I85_07540, partial [bacterium]|nr:hypothetical protein [bacterium]